MSRLLLLRNWRPRALRKLTKTQHMRAMPQNPKPGIDGEAANGRGHLVEGSALGGKGPSKQTGDSCLRAVAESG